MEQQGTVNSGSAGESARLSYEHARDAARIAVGQVREKAADYYMRGKDKVKDLQAGSEGYIKENPLKSVLIAAGAGLVLGLLIRRL